MFRLYLAGAEQPRWRSLLTQAGAQNVAISFSNLRPRLPKVKSYLIAERFDPSLHILLDSGGFAANKKPWDKSVYEDYFREYSSFVTANIDRLDVVTELDFLVAPDLVKKWRNGFWKDIPREKFMPVWHVEYGVEELEALAAEYDHLAVVSNAELGPKLNALINRHGVKLHATMTRPDDLVDVRYTSAMSSSWVSPMRFGETHVWDGRKLRRFPADYKDQRRRQYRSLFERAGFDADLIAKDDYDEVARFTLWSWIQLEAWMARRRGPGHPSDDEGADIVDITAQGRDKPDQHSGNGAVGKKLPAKRNEPAKQRAKTVLPVMGVEERSTVDPQDGSPIRIQVPVSKKEPVRECNSCYISHTCPAFEQDHVCAFELPVAIRTRDQLMAALTAIVEMQIQRIAFGHFVEEKEGGYPDKNVSDEMDRLFRMTEKMNAIADNRDVLNLQIKTRQEGGVLSRVFGEVVGNKARELPNPLDQQQTDALVGDFIDLPPDKK